MDFTFELLEKYKSRVLPLFTALFVVDIILFSYIISGISNSNKTEFDFLDVGQGDSELLQFAADTNRNRIKVLIDGGPENGKALTAITSLLSPTDSYIDIIAITHPQADHIGGLIDIVKKYKVGAFIWAGRENDISIFHELMDVLKKSDTKILELSRGDSIKIGANIIRVVSPDGKLLLDKDLNNSSLVLSAKSASTTALFTGDIGKTAELSLSKLSIIKADIIKVPHHGSRYSVISNFLNAVSPKIAVIEVGKNSYGHPSEDALNGYAQIGATIFRTDKNGTLRFIIGEGRNVNVIKNN